jgi:carbon storage regulator
MLFLTRKLGQSIIINDKIEVKVMEIKGKTVKLGLEFPKSSTVLRKEVYDNVVQQNIESSKAALDGGESFFQALAKQSAEDNKEKN